MTTIYCDEAGNTGEDLFSKEQPFFVLATNDYTKDEALELLASVRGRGSREAKFSVLKRSPEGVRWLAHLLNDPRLNSARVCVDAYHKRFMVVTKLVDLIAETILHEAGHDLYKKGANLALSNMLFYVMPAFCGERPTQTFLQAFVDLIRWRTQAYKENFYRAGAELADACSDEEFKKSLVPFVTEDLFHLWFDSIGPNALDPAIPALFLHIATWGARKNGRFHVIHDRSKPILATQEAFQAMMAMGEQQSAVVGYDRRKFSFPLRSESLTQGDSLDHPQIQIADLCAGAINHLLKMQLTGQKDSLTEIIRNSKSLEWGIGVVAPTPSVSPAELGTEADDGINPVDPVTEQLIRAGFVPPRFSRRRR